MKIAYVVYDKGIHLDNNRGCTLHISHIIKNLREKGHKVKLVYSKCKSNFFLRSIKLAKKCKDADVIHERYSLESLAGFIASKIYRIPLIVEVNAPLIEQAQKYWNLKLDWFQKKVLTYTTKKTFEQAKFIGVLAKELKDYLVNDWKVDPKKIFIVPDTVDAYKFSKKFDSTKTKKKYGIKHGQIIMYMGTLSPWHGIPNLIEAFYEMHKKNKKIQLIIVGEGKMRTQIQTQIEQLGLQDSVIMTGNIEHKKIPEILSIADVTVLPYPRIENFYFSPLKLFEYMAAGKAIVASNQGQITRVLEHNKTGVLIEPGNIEEMTSALTDLIKNKKKRLLLGKNVALRVKNNTWGDHVEKFLSFYRKSIGLY